MEGIDADLACSRDVLHSEGLEEHLAGGIADGIEDNGGPIVDDPKREK